MIPKQLVSTLFLTVLIGLGGFGYAGTFTSSDNTFTLDLPAGWLRVRNADNNSVLTLQKDTASIDIKRIDCTTEACLDEKIRKDLINVKSKKMTVITNTYTGEEIKQIEFSTGEPLFYISFFTSKNDFSAGYFLMNEHAYSVLARNISYAEADLIFSFFSPIRKTETAAVSSQKADEELTIVADTNSPRAYDTVALPEVEILETSVEEENNVNTLIVKDEPAKPQPTATVQLPKWKKVLQKVKQKFTQAHIQTLVSRQMPPYLRQLGHGFDAIVLLIVAWLLLWLVTFFIRLCFRAKESPIQANPNSLYPIRLRRLYGTPALIFRARDNQGNILTSLGSRWHSVFIFAGIFTVVGTLLLLSVVSILEQTALISLSSFVYSTVYSVCSLIIPLGILLFICGAVWGLITLKEIVLYDRTGHKAAFIVQKGFHPLRERYEIYFAKSKNIVYVRRKRFTIRRVWQLCNAEGTPTATFAEKSFLTGLIRHFTGHLWGFLRADYLISGPMESHGTLESTHALFNKMVCNLDKPDAIAARDALAVSLLISMRDRDKWYPWFN